MAVTRTNPEIPLPRQQSYYKITVRASRALSHVTSVMAAQFGPRLIPPGGGATSPPHRLATDILWRRLFFGAKEDKPCMTREE